MLSNQLIFFIVFCVGFLLKIKFIYILTFFLSNLFYRQSKKNLVMEN